MNHIPFSSELLRFPSTEAFIVEAKGNGMIPRIKNGDIIIAEKKTTAENGQIIVCMYNGNRIVKIFYKSVSGTISLCTEIGMPITVDDSDSFIIEGIVKNIFSYVY